MIRQTPAKHHGNGKATYSQEQLHIDSETLYALELNDIESVIYPAINKLLHNPETSCKSPTILSISVLVQQHLSILS